MQVCQYLQRAGCVIERSVNDMILIITAIYRAVMPLLCNTMQLAQKKLGPICLVTPVSVCVQYSVSYPRMVLLKSAESVAAPAAKVLVFCGSQQLIRQGQAAWYVRGEFTHTKEIPALANFKSQSSARVQLFWHSSSVSGQIAYVASIKQVYFMHKQAATLLPHPWKLVDWASSADTATMCAVRSGLTLAEHDKEAKWEAARQGLQVLWSSILHGVRAHIGKASALLCSQHTHLFMVSLCPV